MLYHFEPASANLQSPVRSRYFASEIRAGNLSQVTGVTSGGNRGGLPNADGGVRRAGRLFADWEDT
jgi:hypothetical protein